MAEGERCQRTGQEAAEIAAILHRQDWAAVVNEAPDADSDHALLRMTTVEPVVVTDRTEVELLVKERVAGVLGDLAKHLGGIVVAWSRNRR